MPIPQVWGFFFHKKKNTEVFPGFLETGSILTFSTGKVSVPWSIKSQTGEHKTGCHRDRQKDSGIVDTKSCSIDKIIYNWPDRAVFQPAIEGFTLLTYVFAYICARAPFVGCHQAGAKLLGTECVKQPTRRMDQDKQKTPPETLPVQQHSHKNSTVHHSTPLRPQNERN